MTEYSRSQLLTQITTDFPTNNQRLITAAILTQFLQNFVNSAWNLTTDGTGGTFYITNTDTTLGYASAKLTSTGNTITLSVVNGSGNATLNFELSSALQSAISTATSNISTLQGQIGKSYVSSADTTLADLSTKITSTGNTIAISVVGGAGNETLNIETANTILTWTALTSYYDNTYSAQDASGYHAGYFSSPDASGNVHFQGVVQVTLGTTLTQTPIVQGLPSNIRPSALISKPSMIVHNGDGTQYTAWLQIETNGVINMVTPAASETVILFFDFSYNLH